MKNVKGSNNLRSMYIRSITLGGQDEVIYDGTDSSEIARAFRNAGRSMRNHWKPAVVVVVEGYSNMASIDAMLKEYFSSVKMCGVTTRGNIISREGITAIQINTDDLACL